MTKALRFGLLIVLPFFARGQYQFELINNFRNLQQEASLYQDSVAGLEAYQIHSSIRPLDRERYHLTEVNQPKTDYLPDHNWFNRKLWHEHLVSIEEENYALTLDPLVNFQGGLEQIEEKYRFINTRGFHIEGRIGKQLTFFSTFQENQGRFADYMQYYAARRRVLPGQSSTTRSFGSDNDALDYTMIAGEVSYRPNQFFTFTAGQGRNFIGEGYRSMILSDASFSYPFFRIRTKVWRFEYMNLWGQMNDIRRSAQVTPGMHAKKYYSMHYLSANITDRWNMSFFEAIVVGDTDQMQALDVSYLNPVIFYRPVEYALGSRNANALLGLSSTYKFGRGRMLYGQFILDEFNFEALSAQEGSWLNKFAWQIGYKDYDAWGVEGLFQRLEFNSARPYTFQHREVLTNYAHYGSPLGHPWGANFNELVWQNIYQMDRWEAELQLNYGRVGNDRNGSNWGVDIFRSYESREQDFNNYAGQGDAADYYFLFLRAAYLVNPASNLKLELGIRYREFLPQGGNASGPMLKQRSAMIIFGLRTEIFNRYYDL